MQALHPNASTKDPIGISRCRVRPRVTLGKTLQALHTWIWAVHHTLFLADPLRLHQTVREASVNCHLQVSPQMSHWGLMVKCGWAWSLKSVGLSWSNSSMSLAAWLGSLSYWKVNTPPYLYLTTFIFLPTVASFPVLAAEKDLVILKKKTLNIFSWWTRFTPPDLIRSFQHWSELKLKAFNV